MNRNLSIVAVLFWLASFGLPTIPSSAGGNLIGAELVQKGAIAMLMIPFSLFFPAHIFGLFSNFLLLREACRLFRQHALTARTPSFSMLWIAFVVNSYLGLSTLMKTDEKQMLKGVLSLPGYYFWLASFLILAISRLKFPRTAPALQETNSPKA